MNEQIDLLQIKIEKARSKLSQDTLDAIAAVPWQASILKMRETKGYSFEQLEDLQMETELLLCGLLSPAAYPKELENRMHISAAAANELVGDMNREVFSRIKEELIKITERKKMFKEGVDIRSLASSDKPETDVQEEKMNIDVLKSAGIEISKDNQKPETLAPIPSGTETPTLALEKPKTPPMEIKIMPRAPKEEIPPMLAQKLSGTLKIEPAKTEHTLDNITKKAPSGPGGSPAKPRMDPYREIPE